MMSARKITFLFAFGISMIAFIYALSIHLLFTMNKAFGASLAAVFGAFAMSFLAWRYLHERRPSKPLNGVLLGLFCGCLILLLGPTGFGMEQVILNGNGESPWTQLLYLPFFSLMSFPFVLISMHGYAVLLAGAILGGAIESIGYRN